MAECLDAEIEASSIFANNYDNSSQFSIHVVGSQLYVDPHLFTIPYLIHVLVFKQKKCDLHVVVHCEVIS